MSTCQTTQKTKHHVGWFTCHGAEMTLWYRVPNRDEYNHVSPERSTNKFDKVIKRVEYDKYSSNRVYTIHILSIYVQLFNQPSRYCGYLSWTRFVRSPPSSSIMFSGWLSGNNRVCKNRCGTVSYRSKKRS